MHVDISCTNTMTFSELLWGFIDTHKATFGIYALIILSQPLRDILMPHLVGKVYNSIKDGKDVQPLIWAIVGLVVIIQGIYILDDYITVNLHPELYKFVREKMMEHIFRTKEMNYSDIEIGDVIAKVVKLPSVIHNHIDLIRGDMIPKFFTLVAAACYFLYVDWKIGLPFIGVMAVFISTLFYTSTTCDADAYKRDEKFSLIMSNVNDVLRNMITVMSFDKVDDEFSKMDEIHQQYAGYTKETLNCSLTSKFITIPAMIAYILFVVYYCYKHVKSGKMASGTFVTVAIILFLVMNVVVGILGSWKDVILRGGIIEHSLNTFEECTISRKPYNQPSSSSAGIRFQDVDFSYVSAEMQRPVLKDFTFDIKLKETTLIVGEIGSGKSTIISMLLKYQTPQAGEIFLQGVPYSTIDTKELRRRIAYIPQTPILLNRSVYDNIVYGLTVEKSKEDVATLIRSMGLTKFLDHLPKGLDTKVGVQGSKLSGGQRQIVWVLKAILLNPEIIIMDEPTAAIDDQTKDIVHHLLKTIMVGKTVIMVTHDPYLLQFAKRTVTLKEGRVIKDVRS